MRKGFWGICLVLVALIAVLVPSCGGGGGGQCTIDVKATLDGSPWTGAVNYTLTPVSGSAFIGTNVSASFSVDCGTWTCAYVSGGPSGAYLENITPSANQTVTGTITFTLNFKTIPTEEKCTVDVKATLCDIPWQGAVSYTLTPVSGSVVTGSTVEKTFTVDCGNWTCAYVSGGPSGAYLESITPSATQSVSGSGTITFTLNFELNQDAGIQFLTWTISGTPVQPGTQEAVVCQIIDAHFLQWVDGCPQRVVTMSETSWLNITQVPGQDSLPPAMIYVVDDPSAVNKTPTPLQKLSQVTSIKHQTAKAGDNITLTINKPTLLDVDTAWQLVKGTNYTKTINWLGISVLSQEWEPHPGVLFELVLPVPGLYVFTLQTSAEVVIAGDVNSQNDSTGWSPQLTLMVLA
jgi:hypothetical protein